MGDRGEVGGWRRLWFERVVDADFEIEFDAAGRVVAVTLLQGGSGGGH